MAPDSGSLPVPQPSSSVGPPRDQGSIEGAAESGGGGAIHLPARGWQALSRRFRRTRDRRLLDEAIEFHPDILALEKTRLEPAVSATLYILAALIVIGIVIATFAKVDVIIMANGKLESRSPTIVMQPLERAILQAIHVRTGQVVRKGQIVAELDPTFSNADLDQTKAKLQSMRAEVARLEAEWSQQPYDDVTNADGRIQTLLFRQRQVQYNSRVRQTDEKIVRLRNNLQSSRSELSVLMSQLEVSRELEGMREELHSGRVGSRVNMLEARGSRLRLERDIENTQLRVTSVQQEIVEAQAEQDAFVSEWRSAILGDLIKVNRDVDGVQEQLSKYNRVSSTMVMRAPVDAVVLEVADRAGGSVLRETEPVVSLVPLNGDLDAKVHIPTKDIGYVRIGDVSRIKINAFSFQRHGTLAGNLSAISGDTVKTDKSQAGGKRVEEETVYAATIDIAPDSALRDMPSGARLMPGMELTAEINVGSRSIISYFLYPMLKGLGQSIREP